MKKRWIIISSCLLLCLYACRTGAGAGSYREPFSFFALGDWGRKGNSTQSAVAEQMIGLSRRQRPALILTVGDNFYEDGVSGITDPHWRASYEDVYKDLARLTPWYASLGNHDYRGSIQAQMDYHAVNKNWIMPAAYYSFVRETKDKQKVRFVVIDTNPYVTAYYTDAKYKDKMRMQDTAAQTRWLDSTLSHAGEEWKIVYGHHPVIRVNDQAGESAVLKRTFQPLFDRYGVQAYICGHDHLSQYNQPAQSRTAYVVTGGGSNTLSTAGKESFTLFSSHTPSFAVCDIRGRSLLVRFIDSSGAEMYRRAIPRE